MSDTMEDVSAAEESRSCPEFDLEQSEELIAEVSPDFYTSDEDDSIDDISSGGESPYEGEDTEATSQKNGKTPDIHCLSCDTGFRWSGFYQHRVTVHHDSIIVDHKDGEYHCGECPGEENVFNTWRQYQKHARNIHSNQLLPEDFPCEICGKVLKTKDGLRDHLKFHVSQEYKCEECDKNFVRERQLKQHMQTFHSEGAEKRRKGPKPTAPKGPVECPLCDKTLGSCMTLKIHMRGHTGEKPFVCDDCGKSFVSSSALHKHKRTHTGQKTRHKCDVCAKELSTRSQLRLHMKIHTDDRQFECEVCSSKFVSPTDLKRHQRIHSDTRPHRCRFCNKGFLSKTHLESHMAIHTDSRPYECDICGKRFPDKYRLKGHAYVHNEVEGFACAICDKKFGSPSRLQRHERCHTKERPAFGCEQCLRRFDSALHLRRHQAVHTGDRSDDVIFCRVCDKVFIEPNALKKHTLACHSKTRLVSAYERGVEAVVNGGKEENKNEVEGEGNKVKESEEKSGEDEVDLVPQKKRKRNGLRIKLDAKKFAELGLVLEGTTSS